MKRFELTFAARTVAVQCCAALFGLSSVALAGQSPRTKSANRVADLDAGLRWYKEDMKHFPGQLAPERIGSGKGQFTGAQILALAMFSKDGTFPRSNYALYKQTDLIEADGRQHVVGDEYWRNERPICYYPARLGVDGLAQYVEADNAAHTDPHKGGDFRAFIRTHNSGSSSVPPHPGEFLLIAPGDDRKYFTDDDVVNWNRPRPKRDTMPSTATIVIFTAGAVIVVLLAYVVTTLRRRKGKPDGGQPL